MSGSECATLLQKEGWRLLRVKGSHHIFGKAGRRERISVPIHGNRPLKKGLLQHLLKTAGLAER